MRSCVLRNYFVTKQPAQSMWKYEYSTNIWKLFSFYLQKFYSPKSKSVLKTLLFNDEYYMYLKWYNFIHTAVFYLITWAPRNPLIRCKHQRFTYILKLSWSYWQRIQGGNGIMQMMSVIGVLKRRIWNAQLCFT